MSDPSIFGNLVTVVVLLLLSAFFSACETAFISLGSHHFKKLKERKDAAALLNFWFVNPQKVLITILVANNILNIAASVMVASLSFRYLHAVFVSVVTGIMTFIIIIFGEIIPKSLARRHAEQLVMAGALPMHFFTFILTPVTKLLLLFSNMLVRVFGGRPGSFLPILTEEDLKAMISASEEEGVIEEEEKEMLDGIFRIGDITVKEIMVPRVNMVAVPESLTAGEILKVIAREGYSRLPVYQEHFDKIVGIVYIKDVIAGTANDPSRAATLTAGEIMRSPLFVPETKKVQDLMSELQKQNLQMAVVVDEYGGTAGIVTMEDLVEEIVGEISDEYKKDVSDYQRLSDGAFLVRGTMEIEKVNEELDLGLPEGEVETLAGFILDHLGHIPEKGEKFIWNQHQFFIQEADRKTVLWVRLRKTHGQTEEKYEPGDIPAA